jgi:hypothetical protein
MQKRTEKDIHDKKKEGVKGGKWEGPEKLRLFR